MCRFACKQDVAGANERRLASLEGSVHPFLARDDGATDALGHILAPLELKLKLAAQVMLLKNRDAELVNGLQGRVVGFMTRVEWELSCDCGVRQANIGPRCDDGERLPVVRLSLSSNGTRVVRVPRERFTVEDGEGNQIAQRTQIPLTLSWALSIHKSQGSTICPLLVNFQRVYQPGQAYVALSRAASEDQLEVQGWDRRCVRVHPAVKKFYARLAAASLDSSYSG